jgi:hypothetical protein
MNELVEKWAAERAEMQEQLDCLVAGNIYVGNSLEGLTDEKIADLRQKISNLDQLIATESGHRK